MATRVIRLSRMNVMVKLSKMWLRRWHRTVNWRLVFIQMLLPVVLSMTQLLMKIIVLQVLNPTMMNLMTNPSLMIWIKHDLWLSTVRIFICVITLIARLDYEVIFLKVIDALLPLSTFPIKVDMQNPVSTHAVGLYCAVSCHENS